MIKIWSHFWFKVDQNLIKNRLKNIIDFKVDFRIGIFSFLAKNDKNASVRSRIALQKRTWGFRSLKNEFLVDFYPSNDQKCDLASTKCTLMSVLNVENQDFCSAFSNFLTFFQSKRTSRCPKLVPNDYFCSRGDPFSMGLGKIKLLCRNPWNVKKALCF